MSSVFRATLAIVVVVGTFYFASFVPGALLYFMGMPVWVVVPLSFGLAVFAGHFAWRSLPTAGESPARAADKPQRAMVLGALVVGAIGFAGGFLCPMTFNPGANQAPLLGMLMTGPLGAVLGAFLGWLWWAKYKGPGNRDGDAG